MSETAISANIINKSLALYKEGDYINSASTLVRGDIDNTLELVHVKDKFENMLGTFQTYLTRFDIVSPLREMKSAKILKKPALLDEEIEHAQADIFEPIHEDLKEYAENLKNKNTIGVIELNGNQETRKYFKNAQAACQHIMGLYGINYKTRKSAKER